MSAHTVERAIYDITSSPERTEAYRSDRAAFLSGFPLAADEGKLILDLHVAEMVRRGVNPMLTMRLFNTLEGRDRFPEYIRRLKEM